MAPNSQWRSINQQIIKYRTSFSPSVHNEVNYMDKERSRNDQRSDAHNPTSGEHKSSNDNRSNQMNPNNPEYHGTKNKK